MSDKSAEERAQQIVDDWQCYAATEKNVTAMAYQQEPYRVLKEDIAAAVDSAVDAELRRLVPLVCRDCGSNSSAWADTERTRGWRHYYGTAFERVCPAGPIHEALREMEGRDG